MPWKPEDVEAHKKGLNMSQKKQWCKIANGVLADCMKKGGTEKTCAPKAIRIANSEMDDMMKGKGKQSVPIAAFSFTDTEAFAKIDKEGNVDILAYSGKPFSHWYWGNFAIDVEGGIFSHKFYPVLEQHDLSKKIAFSAKPLTENGQLAIKNVSFLNTKESLEFQENSKQGFPYQASIQGRPLLLETIPDGESAQVNGHTLKGPGTIWRKWTYMETSVCVFGADANTRSKVLSLAEGGEEIEVEVIVPEKETEKLTNIETKEVNDKMDLKELKEKDPDSYNALIREATELAKKEVEAPLTAKLTELTSTVTKQQEQIQEQSSRILSFEKSEVIRKERELLALSERIWAKKLSESEIPEHLFAKVQAHVTHVKFIKDGVFDETAFSAAVDAEIADWVKGGINKSVVGLGLTHKEDENVNQKQEDQVWVKDMAKLAGQTIQ